MTTVSSAALSRRRLLGWLASSCLGPSLGSGLMASVAGPAQAQADVTAAPASALALPLAREAAADIDPSGHLVSEKLDGVRAVWDGRQTLRFRSGRIIVAPAEFLARLPRQPLDGELWLGRGRFEALAAAVRRQQPDAAQWREIRYGLFDLPQAPGPFSERAARLQALVGEGQGDTGATLFALPQWRIDSRAALRQRLDDVVRAGGEGLVLHRADAPWTAGRDAGLWKLKPQHDAEAVVLAVLPGRGRLAGRMGALRVRDLASGLAFHLGSGFSDAQREAPPSVGTVVSYTHRGFTAGGMPRFAAYLRDRPVGL